MPSLISSSTRLSSSCLRSSDLGMFRSKIPRMFNCKKKFLKKGAERDSLKKWIPIMEMQFRGAVYREWCQGGLPEGKVHLILEDGRMYDGMWCYGKRSCPGTFYFNHGDVFQGSWRDDVIHGKGWFYFHTRDRWFANFWKGKASGKGCFYSKSGDVCFGHFQDGW